VTQALELGSPVTITVTSTQPVVAQFPPNPTQQSGQDAEPTTHRQYPRTSLLDTDHLGLPTGSPAKQCRQLCEHNEFPKRNRQALGEVMDQQFIDPQCVRRSLTDSMPDPVMSVARLPSVAVDQWYSGRTRPAQMTQNVGCMARRWNTT
jgi:hypothetical protein